MAYLLKAKAVKVISPAYAEVQTRYQVVLEDDHKFNEATQKLKAQEDVISGLMSRFEVEDEALEKCGAKLNDSAATLFSKPRKTVSTKARRVSRRQKARGNTTGSPLELHPLLEVFLDRLGNVQMMQERVDELTAEYADAQVERSFRLDREESVEPAEEAVFRSQYESAIKQAEQTLAEVSDALQYARKACADNGVSTKDYEQAVESLSDELMRRPSPYDAPGSYELHDPSDLDFDNEIDVIMPGLSTLVTRTMAGQPNQELADRSGVLIPRRESPAQRKGNVKLRVTNWIDVSTEQAAPTAQERAADFLAQAEASQPTTLSTRSSPTLVRTIRTRGSDLFLDRAQSDPHIPLAVAGKLMDPLLARRYSDSQMADMPQLFDTREETFHSLKAASSQSGVGLMMPTESTSTT